MKFPSTFLILPLLAVAACISPGVADADVVHLRTGETIKGRLLPERSDENVLVVEDYLNGSVRTLAWQVVDQADAQEIQERWGWTNKALASVTAHRLVQQLNNGTQSVRGLIVREDEAHYHVMIGGREVKIRKADVLEKTEEEMDPRDIWDPEQLVDRFIEELRKEELRKDPQVADSNDDVDAPSARLAWRMAEYAENAGDYARAKTWYTIAANDEGFLNAAIATQRLERVDSVLRDAAALDTIREIRLALSLNSFRRVREMLEEFPTKHPETGELLRNRLEKAKKTFAQDRADFFALEAKINFPKVVQDLIKDKVEEKGVGLADASAWTRRELPEMAFQQLAERFSRRDDVTPEEARTFWDNRKKSSWRTVTYGSGTFIVNPPKIKPPQRKASGNKKNNNQGGAAPKVTLPKPPTRDQWWETEADPKTRGYWLLAYFVENSGLFEVAEEPKLTPCPQCIGEGL
ncbi:MAG: hypothetical protein O2894_05510, partial [Planctomycetota bacterium]|nr:hypothetical protein [Planctomycetota bacterium]